MFKPVYLSVPVVGVKGQIWSTTPTFGFSENLSGPIFTSAGSLFWESHSSRDDSAELPIPELCTHQRHGQRMVQHAYGKQCLDGRIIFGGDRIRCRDDDHETSSETFQSSREHVSKMLPFVADAEIEGTWAGIMPFSMDGKPLIGDLAALGLPCLWVVTGFGPHGIMEGPGAGKAVATSVIKGDPLPQVLEPASPTRCVMRDVDP